MVVALSPCQGSQCSMIWLMPPLVGADGVDHEVVVEQALAERGAGEGEADPAVLAAEGEVLDVQVPHVRRSALDRAGRGLQCRDAVAWVEADPESWGADGLDDPDEVADWYLLVGFERERHTGGLVVRDDLPEQFNRLLDGRSMVG